MRILLVDDHEIARKGLRSLLDAEPDLEVVGEAGTAHRGFDQPSDRGVDVPGREDREEAVGRNMKNQSSPVTR